MGVDWDIIQRDDSIIILELEDGTQIKVTWDGMTLRFYERYDSVMAWIEET